MVGPAGLASYSVIVPVRNEAATLTRTVPALLAATSGDRADIVYVCNGCTDGSAALIRSLAGGAVRVSEIAQPGKTGALNAGDALVHVFPRFYVDADAVLRAGDLKRLAHALADGDVDLVAPALEFDLAHASRTARLVAETWLALPHARTTAFQVVIGVSKEGRGRWQRFPDVLGDDLFVAAMVPSDRRRRVPEVTAVTRPPASFKGWVTARARWLEGERDLAALGWPHPRPEGQREALLRRLLAPRTALGAALFLAARILGDVLSRGPGRSDAAWQPDRGVFPR